VLGKHSGRNAFKNRLQELGIELESDEALNAAFARFKELADKKHEIFDEDLHALVSDELVTPEQEHYKLVYSRVCSETGEMPRASVILNVGGVEHKARPRAAPVDATFKAIESIAGSGAELLLYSVNAITTGTDAQGEVTTRLSRNDRIVNGNGADTDIVIASARSYLNALNKLHSSWTRSRPRATSDSLVAEKPLQFDWAAFSLAVTERVAR
jgi:2-isopropylmalate synthase